MKLLRVSPGPCGKGLEFRDIPCASESRKDYLLKQLNSFGVKMELLRVLMHLSVHSLILDLSKEVMRLSIDDLKIL